jgi:hypothetical protein
LGLVLNLLLNFPTEILWVHLLCRAVAVGSAVAAALASEFGWHDFGQMLLELLVLISALVETILLLLVAHSVEGLGASHWHCFNVFALCLLLLLNPCRVCLLQVHLIRHTDPA